jgi:hypothetical protein
MENFGFERLIQNVLIGLGAEEARIVSRSQDKGADIVASFLVAGAFRQVVAVQESIGSDCRQGCRRSTHKRDRGRICRPWDGGHIRFYF